MCSCIAQKNGITTWATSLTFFIAGEELRILYTLYFLNKKNILSYHKNTTLIIYVVFFIYIIIVFALYSTKRTFLSIL